MKNTVFILLLQLTFVVSFAQKPELFRIDSLPEQGILLDRGWKWHAGDNPDFAKPDFDDSSWENIDPTKDIMSLPNLINSKVSWIRLTFEIDTNLTKKGLALLVWQNGASELYIDNDKFEQFGHILENGKTIKATQVWGKATFLPISSKYKKHTISIRFGFDSEIKYLKWFGWTNHALRIFICEENNSEVNNFRQDLYVSKLLDIFKIGIFLLMTILHLILYFKYKKQKGNLIMGIYALLAGFAFVTSYCFKTSFNLETVFLFMWMTAGFNILTIVAVIELGYYLFSIRKRLSYLFLIVLSLLSIPIHYYFYDNGWLIIVVLMLLVSFEVIRLGIIAKKDISNSQRIIIYGGIISVIFYMAAIVISSNTNIDFLTHLSYNISYLSLPISFSLFLSFEFANANKSLEKQLQKVETLSIEKQQILATQNVTLEKQVEERTKELKASQNQLIQKEKLASLGELTAGIAHEIQNPLNFVNNFSELSVDLAKELNEEINKSPLTPDGGILIAKKDKEYLVEILTDLSTNQEKINHHGKRASSIVKGMLEHSRTSTGVKELTDINKLSDEYLRLSYHGLRAKNKDFNADFKTDFDENLPKINVISQDLGRVLLNIINNAFQSPLTPDGGTLFTKKVLIKTFKIEADENSPIGGWGAVSVTDNGSGIPADILPKIFQPFFTTKPTGEGTGLGLSLSYDIITKGHGGTLEVESVEGEGTTFTIKLPIQ